MRLVRASEGVDHRRMRGLTRTTTFIAFATLAAGCSSPGTDDGGDTADARGGDSGSMDVVASDRPIAPTDTPAATDAPPGTDVPSTSDGGALGPRGLFPATHFFYRDVSGMKPATESAAIIRAFHSAYKPGLARSRSPPRSRSGNAAQPLRDPPRIHHVSHSSRLLTPPRELTSVPPPTT
jgi:hypothetical protein